MPSSSSAFVIQYRRSRALSSDFKQIWKTRKHGTHRCIAVVAPNITKPWSKLFKNYYHLEVAKYHSPPDITCEILVFDCDPITNTIIYNEAFTGMFTLSLTVEQIEKELVSYANGGRRKYKEMMWTLSKFHKTPEWETLMRTIPKYNGNSHETTLPPGVTLLDLDILKLSKFSTELQNEDIQSMYHDFLFHLERIFCPTTSTQE